MDRLIHVVVTITLFEMMVATGLGARISELRSVAKSWSLVVRALVANYIAVPIATVLLLRLFQPQPMVAVGFLLLAVCPGAPYAPSFSAIAKGNVPAAIGMMVLLAGSSAVMAPLLLGALLPLASTGTPLKMDVSSIVVALLCTQLAPLCIGLAVRILRPTWAERLQKPAVLASKILNLAALALILVTQVRLLQELRLIGIVGMAVLWLVSWLTGWALGGSLGPMRRTLAVTTSLRNVSVALVIASQNFAGTSAVTAVVAYGLFSLLVTLGMASRLSAVNNWPAPAAS